jgi:hypothetical protein
MYGEVPAMAPLEAQRRQLAPLRRFLELEGWEVEQEGHPLVVRRGGRAVAVRTYPALLDSDAPGFVRPPGFDGVLLRDYVVTRDLPAAYDELRRVIGSK